MTEDVDSDIEISDESDAENTNNNENDDNSEDDDDLLYSSNADEEAIQKDKMQRKAQQNQIKKINVILGKD